MLHIPEMGIAAPQLLAEVSGCHINVARVWSDIHVSALPALCD
jgi:hypothetical protein